MGVARETRFARLLRGGTEGNARLIGLTGLVLLVLLAVEGVTILDIVPLLSVHVFVGLLLIPPVALKLAATGYRLVRYYTRAAEYVRKGPPLLLMRMIVAPGLVAATLVLFATGVTLLAVGPSGAIVLGLHKASFIVWLGGSRFTCSRTHSVSPASSPPTGVATRTARRGRRCAPGSSPCHSSSA
jgi:hypothetical protein